MRQRLLRLKEMRLLRLVRLLMRHVWQLMLVVLPRRPMLKLLVRRRLLPNRPLPQPLLELPMLKHV